ncbi:MAG: 50S ribosomal protein L25 [Bacillota bacterium]|nr:50S ribosomal protein L25 [Bacillota bacterium]
MSSILLEAAVREQHNKGAVKQLRASGYLPGVLYGKNNDAIKLTILLKEFEQAIHRGAGKGLINLNLNNGGKVTKVPVMIKEAQTHPVKGMYTHVDLYQVNLKEKITTEVAINLQGEAKGVKEGGLLQQQLRVLEVKCMPTAIPESIVVDVSALEIGDQLLVEQLTVPQNIEILSDLEKLVVNVVAPRAVEEEAEEDETAAEPAAEEMLGGEATAEKEE